MSNADDAHKIANMLKQGAELEGQVLGAGQIIREQSKNAYASSLLDARMMLTAIMAHLFTIKSGVPGKTNISADERLLLIAGFFQGCAYTETLISEGQYIKASAVLKQDFEMIVRLEEISKSVSKYGQVPQMRNAPPGSQRYYGELNDVAHISKPDLLKRLVGRHENGVVVGVSPVPIFDPVIAKNLYEFHLFTLMQICRHQMILFAEMYGIEDEGFVLVLNMFVHVVEMLKKAGFEVVEEKGAGSS